MNSGEWKTGRMHATHRNHDRDTHRPWGASVQSAPRWAPTWRRGRRTGAQPEWNAHSSQRKSCNETNERLCLNQYSEDNVLLTGKHLQADIFYQSGFFVYFFILNSPSAEAILLLDFLFGYQTAEALPPPSGLEWHRPHFARQTAVLLMCFIIARDVQTPEPRACYKLSVCL